jgi:hypothetical protein
MEIKAKNTKKLLVAGMYFTPYLLMGQLKSLLEAAILLSGLPPMRM